MENAISVFIRAYLGNTQLILVQRLLVTPRLRVISLQILAQEKTAILLKSIVACSWKFQGLFFIENGTVYFIYQQCSNSATFGLVTSPFIFILFNTWKKKVHVLFK